MDNLNGTDFRFERLDVYQLAVKVIDPLFDIAEIAEQHRKFRFANQLEGAALSVTNNIAEGSGSDSDIEFARFVGIARKSVYECVNILLILNQREIIDPLTLETNYQNLISLSVKLHNFRKNLISARIKTEKVNPATPRHTLPPPAHAVHPALQRSAIPRI